MATSVLGLKTFAASDPVDVNEVNDNYVKIDNGVKTAMQGRAAHNLLDNSYWKVQSWIVNQRGQTSYTEGYSIDRWITSGSGSVSISSGGITVSGVSFRQLVILPAGTYTLAFKVSNGTLLYYNFTYDGASTITKIGGANETTGAYINLYNDANGVVACQFVLGADYTYTLEWAALYEGSYTADTLPAYVPKGYAAELAECERYHVPIGSAVWMTGFFKVGEGLVVEIPAARNMRINNPTVVLNNPKAFTGTGWNDLTYRSFSISRHSAKIVFDFSDPSAAQASYGSAFLVIGIDAINADL